MVQKSKKSVSVKPKFKMTDEAKRKHKEKQVVMKKRYSEFVKTKQPKPASIVAKVKADSEKRRADNMKDMLERSKNYS